MIWVFGVGCLLAFMLWHARDEQSSCTKGFLWALALTMISAGIISWVLSNIDPLP